MLDPVVGFEMATQTLVEAMKTHLPTPTAVPTIVPGHDSHYEKAGDTGKTVLWVVFIVMLFSSAAFSLLAYTVPLSKRLFHVITAMITVFAALSYFAMATGQGVAYNTTKLTHHHKGDIPNTHYDVHRQVFYARYIDWALTTPLLLLDLGLLAGMSGGHIILAIACDVIMVLTGLFAAFPQNDTQKWGWYTIACVAFVGVIWHLAINGRKAASVQGKAGTLYVSLAVYTVILWTAYPIVWGVADGSRILSVDAEIIAYAILDILAKPVFGFWLLLAHKQIDEAKLDVGGFWAHGLSGEGAVRLGDDDGA